ncbi:MAG: hypothetical protein ABIK65_04500, partial [Candidatus Eisenbacteria bacterium]
MMRRTLRFTVPFAAAVLAGFPLLGGHAGAEGEKAEGYPHGEYRGECELCHAPTAWKPLRFAERWSHDDFGFPLESAHQDLDCARCHRSLDFTVASHACIDCHQDIHQGEFGLECARCHGPRDFRDRSSFVLAHRITRFPLTGAHASAECEACHAGESEDRSRFVNTPVECEACHRSEYDATTDPNHEAAAFPADCSSCHETTGWPGAGYDHSFFPLEGGHGGLSCSSCHGDAPYEETSAACLSCHGDDYDGAFEPDHSAGFPTECTVCHSTARWEGADFGHESFPLEKGHAGVLCATCHEGVGFEETPVDCYACHRDDFDGTADPRHEDAGFPTDCATCHETETWPGALFDHTHFPLEGGHGGAACATCHGDAPYEAASPECYSCHAVDYEGASDPDHGAGFPTDCARCHTTAAWGGALFEHMTFALTGAHGTADCSGCHGDGVFEGTAGECALCHQEEFAATTNPDHGAAGFGTDCATCHETETWPGALFDHTHFPLEGGHGGAACATCHGDGPFEATSPDCYSCHAADYGAASDPDHGAGFPTDCARCHTTAAWEGAEFGHTAFALTGAHGTADCSGCHGGGVFEGTTNDCASCHMEEYAGTANPNHGSAGFGTTCAGCHNTAGWASSGSVDHGFFPLTGVHGGLSCNACHGDGVYEGTSAECSICHIEDYDGAADPDHRAGLFPTDCLLCHDMGGWPGATFDHSFFALSGGHSGLTCGSCHAGGIFQGTSPDCYECHQADYESTTDPNHVAAGFPTDCAQCHDINGWPGATFDHSFFALSGGHSGLGCGSCHAGGIFQGTSPDCYECHQADYESTTNPNHVAAGFPTDCAACHDINGWPGATFDHSFFALNGGHSGLTCGSCHAGGIFQGTSPDCYECHQADYESTTNPNHAGAGFPTDCAACQDINGWPGATFDHSFFALSGGPSGLT